MEGGRRTEERKGGRKEEEALDQDEGKEEENRKGEREGRGEMAKIISILANLTLESLSNALRLFQHLR